MVRPQVKLAARSFLDLGRVEERGDDRCRADTDRETCLHELRPALLSGIVPVVVVGHVTPLKHFACLPSMFAGATMEAGRQ